MPMVVEEVVEVERREDLPAVKHKAQMVGAQDMVLRGELQPEVQLLGAVEAPWESEDEGEGERAEAEAERG